MNGPMHYVLAIYTDEAVDKARFTDAAARAEYMAGYGRFHEVAGARMLGGEALKPTATATTVRVRDGEIGTTDGPFAETKEALGGFYLVEAADLDEAIALAAEIPAARHGAIEVRPVVMMSKGESWEPSP